MKKFLIIFFWLLSIASAALYTYENPEQLDKIKKYLKDEKNLVLGDKGEILRTPGNSFMIEFSKVVSFSKKTAFIIHDEKSLNFKKKDLKIYFQNGDLFNNSNLKKTNLSKNFTTIRNGGIKTVFIYKNKAFALVSSLLNKCYYASIISLNNANEIFKTKCLPKKKIDFNGLGSSHIHTKDSILLSIGTPEQESSEIRQLAQNKNSMFGKIIAINKKKFR